MLTVDSGSDSDLNDGVVGREEPRGDGAEFLGRRWRPGDKKTGSLKVSAVVEDAAAAGGHLEVKNKIDKISNKNKKTKAVVLVSQKIGARVVRWRF